jgi:hypothetical protein
LTEQIPSLKKQNLKFEEYASKSVQDLFPEAVMKSAIVQEFNYAVSAIAINNGKGIFEITRLPYVAQWSSINAVLCTDLNYDGRKDILVGGNHFNFLPQFARLDGSYGNVWLNKAVPERGTTSIEWQVLPATQSGFELRGEIKDMISINSARGNQLLVLQNDSIPQLYIINGINK